MADAPSKPAVDLLTLAEAAELAGETPAIFWSQATRHRANPVCSSRICTTCGIYPPPLGWPRVRTVKDGKGRKCLAHWRRDDVMAAVARRDAARKLVRHGQ